jgi:hypothetical protein
MKFSRFNYTLIWKVWEHSRQVHFAVIPSSALLVCTRMYSTSLFLHLTHCNPVEWSMPKTSETFTDTWGACFSSDRYSRSMVALFFCSHVASRVHKVLLRFGVGPGESSATAHSCQAR